MAEEKTWVVYNREGQVLAEVQAEHMKEAMNKVKNSAAATVKILYYKPWKRRKA